MVSVHKSEVDGPLDWVARETASRPHDVGYWPIATIRCVAEFGHKTADPRAIGNSGGGLDEAPYSHRSHTDGSRRLVPTRWRESHMRKPTGASKRPCWVSEKQTTLSAEP